MTHMYVISYTLVNNIDSHVMQVTSYQISLIYRVIWRLESIGQTQTYTKVSANIGYVNICKHLD